MSLEQLDSLDSAILAIAQVLQPVRAEDVQNALESSATLDLLDYSVVGKKFKRLQTAQYLWRTHNDFYVVTPKAEQLIRTAMKPKTRDKIRLFTLNKRRYNEN